MQKIWNSNSLMMVKFTILIRTHGAGLRRRLLVTGAEVLSADAYWKQEDAMWRLKGTPTNPQILIGCRSFWTHTSNVILPEPGWGAANEEASEEAGETLNVVTETNVLRRESVCLPDRLIATWFTVHSNMQRGWLIAVRGFMVVAIGPCVYVCVLST